MSHNYATKEGRKVQYRCNRVQLVGQQCPAAVALLFHVDRSEVTLYRTGDDHDHQNKVVSRGLPPELREPIKELYADGK